MKHLLPCVVLIAAAVLLTPAGAVAKKPPPPPLPGGGGSSTSTYVKNYANVLDGVQYQLTPQDVQARPDGGWIGVASTDSPPAQSGNGVGPPVGWLLKASAVGAPQWQEEIGCFGLAPGYYSIPVSLRRTSDGGYVLAGGSLGCGSGSVCTSGLQCGLVERIDGAGALVWAQVYSAGTSAINQIETASDGGFVAVGSACDASDENCGALILKLDGSGNIQWQREVGPTGSDWAYLKTVRQTSDGGYVAAGELRDGTTSNGLPLMSVLVVKLDAAGNVTWQRGFNDVGASGVTATEHTDSVVQTADGGYAIGGNWSQSFFPGECCAGGLLLKLSPAGSLQWQRAYSGGVSCGYQECVTLSGQVTSLHQAADGGYLLAGDADDPQLVPWLAKVDGTGALVWQESDYQANSSTGSPLSEYFASAALTPVGPAALGWTENYSNGLGELLGLQTDANGNVGTCAQIHMDSPLSAIDPGLTGFAPNLTTSTNVASHSAAPVQTKPTSVNATTTQC